MSKELTYLEAIREALIEEMQRDPKVFVLGEDVGPYGGAFGVTQGLYDMFGELPDLGLVLRPSLCPHHAMVYAERGRSYRDLPLRVGELGDMYRNERSGVLNGLWRVRAISLNDGHVFCAPEQAVEEVREVLRLMRQAHQALGVRVHRVRLSLRSPEGGKYVDDPRAWAWADSVLRDALDDVDYDEVPGEAAFYGPKVDVQVLDAAGRQWSLATVQVDVHQPVAFGLSYVDSSGARQRPIMVHRSLVGSLERLFAHLSEVHGGAFPAWYAPRQVAVLPVGPEQDAPAAAFARRCVDAGLRAEAVYAGSLAARVHGAVGVPFVAVLGAREVADDAVSLRGGPELLSTGSALAELVRRCAPPPIYP